MATITYYTVPFDDHIFGTYTPYTVIVARSFFNDANPDIAHYNRLFINIVYQCNSINNKIKTQRYKYDNNNIKKKNHFCFKKLDNNS